MADNSIYFPGTNIEIKAVQDIQLEILLEFDRICKKNNIKYCLFAGTLLGAIRHNGFIPWDDDVDVCMLREEYEKFLIACKKDLSDGYFLQDYNTDKNYPHQFAKLRKNNTLYVEERLSDLEIHHGIFIDIFPFDNIEPDKLTGKIQRNLLNILRIINSCRSKALIYSTKNNLKKYLRVCIYYVVKLFPKNIMDKLITKIACIFNDKETELVGELSISTSKDLYNRFSLKKSVFYDTIEWEFEGYKFPVPREYDYVLTKNYGDYMTPPPPEKQKPHHYVIKISFDTTSEA